MCLNVLEGLDEVCWEKNVVSWDLPPPVDADYEFASYHSKTEINGHILRYTRTFEVKELSVPLSKIDEFKTLYRIIATDERNTAVLKPAKP